MFKLKLVAPILGAILATTDVVHAFEPTNTSTIAIGYTSMFMTRGSESEQSTSPRKEIVVNKNLIINAQPEARAVLASGHFDVPTGGMIQAALATIKSQDLKQQVELEDQAVIEFIAKAKL